MKDDKTPPSKAAAGQRLFRSGMQKLLPWLCCIIQYRQEGDGKVQYGKNITYTKISAAKFYSNAAKIDIM